MMDIWHWNESFVILVIFHLKDNEVAAVKPPPVVLYPQSQDQSNNNGAEHYSQGGTATRPIEPPPQQPAEPPRREPTRPDPRYDPRFPDPRYPSQTDGRYHPSQPENRYPVTPQRRPSPPVPQPAGHVHTSGPGVSITEYFTHEALYTLVLYEVLRPFWFLKTVKSTLPGVVKIFYFEPQRKWLWKGNEEFWLKACTENNYQNWIVYITSCILTFTVWKQFQTCLEERKLICGFSLLSYTI